MAVISVIQGTRYTPGRLIAQMARNRKLSHIECTPVNVMYSPCWVFAFSVSFALTRRYTRRVGWYGGLDEQHVVPGVVHCMPETAEITADEAQILPDKLTREQAEQMAWEYNKRWIRKKYRILFSPPVKTAAEASKYYKPVYLLKFDNKTLGQTLYKAMDSLSGDLENLNTKEELA